jgi:hypothetical protein
MCKLISGAMNFPKKMPPLGLIIFLLFPILYFISVLLLCSFLFNSNRLGFKLCVCVRYLFFFFHLLGILPVHRGANRKFRLGF